MNAQVSNLANLMRRKQGSEQKFVLMLGAGASISSGVPPTNTIMEQLLDLYGKETPGKSLQDRFSTLWRGSTPTTRDLFLSSYLEKTPSVGYIKLANLIKAGYFDLVLTFNFDRLLEKALAIVGIGEYKVIIKGETRDDAMQKLLEAKEPQFKLAKLHGSLRSADYFLFSDDEMHRYPEPIETLLQRVTSGDVLICGYAFRDQCVRRAFAEQGEMVVDVDRDAPPSDLRLYMRNRRSEQWAISTDFDPFFTDLHRELLEPRPDEPKPKLNPFKFLKSYEAKDRASLTGRDTEIVDFFEALKQKPDVIVVSGPGKAGKTSVVKAALQPGLDSTAYWGLYLRCRKDLASSITEGLKTLKGWPTDLDLPASLKQVSTQAGERRAVLFLDQFERALEAFDLTTPEGGKALRDVLREHVFKVKHPNITFVLVITDPGNIGTPLLQQCMAAGAQTQLVLCLPFDQKAVANIIQSLAQKAEIVFDQRIVDELSKRFHDTRTQQNEVDRFTLAHVQAVCHILATKCNVDFDTFNRTFDRTNLEALNQAINVCDIISFVEDFTDDQAHSLRNIIKVPLRESKDQIAQFIIDHFAELLSADESPAPRRPSGPLTG